MRAVVVTALGGPEALQLRQVDEPIPDVGQVLVEVAFASVTFVETQIRAGRGPALRQPPALPYVPGNGVGGRVSEVGPGVDPALRGATVVTTTGGTGGYAERALAPADQLVLPPPGVDLRDAVALLADGRTALWLLRRAQIAAGEWVLVEAAGGGVGSLLVQLASVAGARVIAAARGQAKLRLAETLGASAVVDYAQPGWAQRVLEATGGAGVSLVFDGVGGAIGAEAITTLRRGGRVCSYGMASGSWLTIAEEERATRELVVLQAGPPSPDEARALTQEALRLAAAGRLRPTVGQVFPLAEAAAAHRAIEERRSVGKTLLVP